MCIFKYYIMSQNLSQTMPIQQSIFKYNWNILPPTLPKKSTEEFINVLRPKSYLFFWFMVTFKKKASEITTFYFLYYYHLKTAELIFPFKKNLLASNKILKIKIHDEKLTQTKPQQGYYKNMMFRFQLLNLAHN